MKIRCLLRRALTAGLLPCLGVVPVSSTAYAAPAQALAQESAIFEGQTIDLGVGWGAAHACAVSASGTRCYRTEAQMDLAESFGGFSTQSTCATSTRLYADTSYGGAVLALSTRGVYIGLSGYGFDNVTSSYQVGGCAATFYDTAGGTGTYPGSTGAGALASSMVSGWDNRISSIRIS